VFHREQRDNPLPPTSGLPVTDIGFDDVVTVCVALAAQGFPETSLVTPLTGVVSSCVTDRVVGRHVRSWPRALSSQFGRSSGGGLE
jgi:hypothetical protein